LVLAVATTGRFASFTRTTYLALCHVNSHTVELATIETNLIHRITSKPSPPYASTPSPSATSCMRAFTTKLIPVSSVVTTMKHPVAMKVKQATMRTCHHFLKKEMKRLSGVSTISKPVQKIPMICRPIIASMTALNWLPAFPDLFGILIAEKSRTVLPSWSVEFV
jgi:hypothetical protein